MSRKDELLEAFHRFQNALASNDVTELDALMAPDYRGYSIRGELEGRDMVLKAWKPGGISMIEFRHSDLQIDIRGEIGILTGHGYIRGSFQDTPWEHHLHFCDLYLEGNDGWRLLLSHAVEVHPDSLPLSISSEITPE